MIAVSSYTGATTQPSKPAVRLDLVADGGLAGQAVLIVDDILDTGGTLRRVQQTVAGRRPASVETVVLLRKREKAPADLHVD